MCEGLKQLAHSPENLFATSGHLRGADRAAEPIGDDICTIRATEHFGHNFLAAQLPNDLNERPVGDTLAVGETAASQYGRRVAHQANKLIREPRLAYSG